MIKLDDKGLLPAIAQDANNGQVIMLGYVNSDSLKRTLKDREVWFYSRSRSDLWHKGETSGYYMHLVSAHLDCDGDAILLKVNPEGPICHTGNATCFFTPLEEITDFSNIESGPSILEELFAVIQSRKRDMPAKSYTTKLFKEGADRISQKVIEEAGETALAGARGDKEDLVQETADLIYHILVLLSATGTTPEKVWAQLRARRE